MGRGRRVINRQSGADESAITRQTIQEDITYSEDPLYDEIGQHHNLKEKILLEQSGSVECSSEDEPLIEGDVEEVMPLLCSDSDTEDEDEDRDEDADRDEDEDEYVQSSNSEQDEEQVPSQAWGHSKAIYYNTDYVDDEVGGSSDEELAEEEEREALDMQQRLAGSLEERDFGIEPLMEVIAVEESNVQLITPGDLTGLNDQDKMRLLCQESPEFMDLYSDCRSKLKEDINTLSPLMLSARSSALPVTPQGLDYLNTKSMLSKMYCLNIVYYLYLKAKQLPVKDHPVVARIVQLRELIGNLSTVDDFLKSSLAVAVTTLDALPDIGHHGVGNTAQTNTTKTYSEDPLYDEIGQHHNLKGKILLEQSGSVECSSEDEPLIEGDVEEVMPLLCSDSDTEDEEDEDRDEDEYVQSSNSEQDEEQVPSQAWGHSKAIYYNTDYVDDEVGGSSDEELAEEEEREALDMQQRLAGSLEERDFGIEPLMEVIAVEESNVQLITPGDLTGLNDQDKMRLLCQESPEFMDLYSDCRSKLKEDINTLSPLMLSARSSALPVTPQGLDYLNTKSMLSKMYCLNIVYYLYLKAKQLPVKDHPVVARIVQLRELIGNLSTVDDFLKSSLAVAVTTLDALPDIGHHGVGNTAQTNTTKQSSPEQDAASRKRRGKQVTFDDPLTYYEEVKSAKKRKKTEHQKDKEKKDKVPEVAPVDADGKRAITYQIARNQGLMPKRKKEQRNPRVRHRKKFHKALTKYKSMARPVQYEMQRYGGEKTGIKANLSRSVKIK